MLNPNNFTFDGQKQDEIVIFAMRRHPFVLNRLLLKLLGLTLLVAAALLWQGGPSTLFTYTFFILLFLGGYWAGRDLFIWSRGISILTNQRIINMDQKGFFSRVVGEAALDKIQNVTNETKGVFPTMLNFGNVKIQTSGTTEWAQITLEQITNPHQIQQQISSAAKKYGGQIIEVDTGQVIR